MVSFKINVMKPRLYFDTSVFGGIFDEEFEVLEITICRPYSIAGNLPPHGNYDIMDDYKGVSTVYEYLVDESGKLIVDYYGFEAISLISLREV